MSENVEGAPSEELEPYEQKAINRIESSEGFGPDRGATCQQCHRNAAAAHH
jgi:hypothetical protein